MIFSAVLYGSEISYLTLREKLWVFEDRVLMKTFDLSARK